MNVSVWGSVPGAHASLKKLLLVWMDGCSRFNIACVHACAGNDFDAAPHVQLSQMSDKFTSADVYQYRRSITVELVGAPQHPLRLLS